MIRQIDERLEPQAMAELENGQPVGYESAQPRPVSEEERGFIGQVMAQMLALIGGGAADAQSSICMSDDLSREVYEECLGRLRSTLDAEKKKIVAAWGPRR